MKIYRLIWMIVFSFEFWINSRMSCQNFGTYRTRNRSWETYNIPNLNLRVVFQDFFRLAALIRNGVPTLLFHFWKTHKRGTIVHCWNLFQNFFLYSLILKNLKKIKTYFFPKSCAHYYYAQTNESWGWIYNQQNIHKQKIFVPY